MVLLGNGRQVGVSGREKELVFDKPRSVKSVGNAWMVEDRFGKVYECSGLVIEDKDTGENRFLTGEDLIELNKEVKDVVPDKLEIDKLPEALRSLVQ